MFYENTDKTYSCSLQSNIICLSFLTNNDMNFVSKLKFSLKNDDKTFN